MSCLTKAQIFGAKDLQTEKVEIEEWNGYVNIRAITGTERDLFEQSMFQGKGKNRRENFDNLRARLISLAAVDDEGERIFSEKDTKELGKKNASALDKLFAKAQELSGMRQADVEELVKNSEESPGEDSLSD